MFKMPIVNMDKDTALILTRSIDFLQKDCHIICQLSPEIYRLHADNRSSIGAHIRHILEYFQIFNKNFLSKNIHYDDRERQIIYEQNPAAALEALTEGFLTLENILKQYPFDTSLTVHCLAGYGLPTLINGSTLGREVIYIMDHGVHHLAIIKMIAQGYNIFLPDDFGVAPATRIYNDSKNSVTYREASR